MALWMLSFPQIFYLLDGASRSLTGIVLSILKSLLGYGYISCFSCAKPNTVRCDDSSTVAQHQVICQT